MAGRKRKSGRGKVRGIDYLIILSVLTITLSPLVATMFLKMVAPDAVTSFDKDFGVLAPMALTGLISFVGGRAVGKKESEDKTDK